MIVTVTPNPALDITYHIGSPLKPGQVNRVDSVSERAGGKGINVARILAANGVPVCALGLVGGTTGANVAALLDAAGVAHDLTEIAGATRRTVVVADVGSGANRSDVEIDATGLWEPGPVVSPAEWDRFTAVYRATLAEADVVVLSGSLPRGVPSRAYQQLIAAAADAGVPAVLDTDGPALRHGLRAEPAVAKPNAAELAGIVGQPITDTGSAITAAGLARLLGARDLVVSLGSVGLVAVTDQETWTAQPPRRFPGNATGAGDAAVAALAVGLAAGESWPDRLVRATAWSAAAAAERVAGEFHLGLAAALGAEIEARRWPAPPPDR